MKKNSSIHLLLLLILLLAGLACGESPAANNPPVDNPPADGPVVPKGERTLGIDITETEDADYDKALQLAQEAGSQAVALSIFWDDFEVEPGVYQPAINWLEIANLYYPAAKMKVSLVISVIDTNRVRLPADLMDTPFDDPVMLARFTAFLDYVFNQIPEVELTSLAIGNEIDGVLGADPVAWAQYQVFFEGAADYARTKRPGARVGAKVMHSGLVGASKPNAQALNQHSDVVMVTYYPLNADMTVKDPGVVAGDFDAVAAAYPNRPIFFLETGYPSSEENSSSEAQQAEFVRQVFLAWDAHATQIEMLFFTWLTDLPKSSVDKLSGYYGVTDRAFGEFLRSLGLRTFPGAGQDKEAFKTLKQQARARGW